MSNVTGLARHRFWQKKVGRPKTNIVKTLRKAIRRSACGLTLALFFAGTAFGQQARVKPVHQITVEDSRGKAIGRSFSTIGLDIVEHGGTDLEIRALVLLQIDQQLVPVAVGRDGFFGGRVLWFESENCIGTPFFSAEARSSESAQSLVPRAAIAPPGQTLYIVAPGAAPRPITIRSILEHASTCRNQTFSNISALPSQGLLNLLTVFTPPFGLRAAP